ncbi:molecular chaperone DnaK [Clostridium sp. MF28]|uniref:Hsp70 family protein n=1 Tax=Clostridium TaxID=1485 RepID=UPI000CF8E118|nr:MULTISPECIES: Hsp70 family protein [Clostridium]AVK47519.1 molecular chaperone DnaK [Clostridium sp. MF28]PSM58691.1 Hsp70 family protein [Clostridium diolis]
MGIIVGIDLGTTNSAVACLRRGKVQIVPIDGKNTMPSVISVRNDEIIVGHQAKSRLLIDPKNSVASAKREVGKDVHYNLDGRIFTPEDVAVNILRTIKIKAGEALGEEVEQAVVTVPAYFTSEQRQITKSAAERAGLKVLRLMPEPTAAALDYGIDQNKNQTLMVYDLGGGTFDISIMQVKGNDFEILAVDGDARLGGDDFDQIICNVLFKQINKDLNISITLEKDRKYISAVTKIKEAAEKAKIDLSDMDEVEIIIPNLIGDYCLEKTITRSEFNELAKPLIDRTIEKMNKAMQSINYTEDDIDRVILVGGSTKMPIVRESVKNRIKEPYMAPNVDEVVARGAALMAASLATPDYQIKSGIDLSKKIVVKEKTVFTYGVDMLDSRDKLIFKPIVRKGTQLPTADGVIGATSRPYQEGVLINVYRGDNPIPNENEYLGELSLDIIKPMKDQIPILALFEIDENMIIRFRSVQIPMNREFMELVENYDIKRLKAYLDMGRLDATEIIIDAKENGR